MQQREEAASVSLRGGCATLRSRFVVALAVAAAIIGFLAPAASAGVVPTDRGPVRGVATPTVNEYLGIPYARPPVGDLRWRPPQPAQRWRTPLDASQFANHCPQNGSPFGRGSTSEDCLYLNVYAPRYGNGRGHAKGLPVMFWIHGGGFTVGESDDYDPTRLVRQGVVVVTFNYRLGALGFLAHPALTAESGASGDFGLLDQQAALRWVRRNIAKFGGDPSDVTIFGESAGGLSVHAQLASPLAAGLFQGAVVESGAYALSQPSLEFAEAQGSGFAQTVGCPGQTAACLRSVPVSAVLANQIANFGELTPPVDGKVLPTSIGEAIESGQFNRVPVIEGSNHDEFSVFYKTAVEDVFGGIPAAFYPIVVNLFVQALDLGADSGAILAQYPISDYQQRVGLALTAIGTDAIFACPGRRAAQGLSRFVPTFAYEFNDRNAPQVFLPPASIPYGAYHAAELQYLFDSSTLGGHSPLTDDQEQLAAAMVRYWTQFAKAGDPNAPGDPEWPAYTTANDLYESLVPPTPEVETGFAADHKCAFWDAQ
jgi:para-nitrobenzyl esterase